MLKQVFVSFLLFGSVYVSYAQTDIDALRYGTTSIQGSARNIALGNTMGTIGADITSLSTNPAGIAKFSSSEFMVTPAIPINRSSSTYLGNTTKDGAVKFQLANIGLVVMKRSTETSVKKKWSGIRFGIALNRLADYNDVYSFGGYNDRNSLLNAYWEKLSDKDVIQSEADAKTKYPFDASIAYQLDLLTSDTLGNFYTATNNGNMQQDFTIRKSGGFNEVVLGVASSYNDKLMIGASLGVPIINYTERIMLTETDSRDSAFDLNSFSVETYSQTRGAGINFKVGIIAMPVTNLRLSLAFQTPGILFMNDAFITNMEVDYAGNSVILTGESPEGASRYKYVQPWRMTAGVGYIHKYGLVSVEYDLSHAGDSKFTFDEKDAKAYENYVNDRIKSKYGTFHTIKFGAEFKYDPIRIRAGIQYRSSPFKSSAAPTGVSTYSLTYSAGFGYRGNHFFADIAYVQTNTKELFVPYQLSTEAWNPVPAAVLTTKKPAIVFTVGYKL